MCKFYSGFGGVRGADSRINFRPAGQERSSKSATTTCK